jgi:hypothetical protein
MSDYIFGIKCNGVSISPSRISIDDDQSQYDYICNVTLKDSWNDNGTYDVSIINKDYIQGMPVGKWRIIKAWISYNWGDSFAKLRMEDEDGTETCDIVADNQNGSKSSYGFNIYSLTLAIFTKAQEIVRDYPNAKVCNAIMELNKSKKDFHLSYLIDRYQEVLNKSNEEFIDFMEYAAGKISKYLSAFKEVKELLEDFDDPRSKKLLKDITSDCKHLLDYFKIINN